MSTKTTPTSASTVGASSSLAAKLANLRNGSGRLKVTWESAESETLREIISAFVEEGHLVSFSRTSDGGALVFTVIADKVPSHHYAANEDELQLLMETIANLIKHNR